MTLVDNGTLYRTFTEDVHEGMRLGRNLWLDARSLAYRVENSAALMSVPLTNQHWQRVIPILNQGFIGSCVGNAGTGALGTQPFYNAVGRTVLTAPDDPLACETFAVKLYSDSTAVDPWPGTYLPLDTGSSGLAACQVLRTRGIIKAYNWSVTPHGFLQLLQWGPALLGMPWYNAFFQPDRNGFIDSNPNWLTSGVAGGHEVEAVGVELDATNLLNSVILFANSWGSGWSDAGYFRMRLNTYTQISGCDLKQYVVAGVPPTSRAAEAEPPSGRELWTRLLGGGR